MDLLVLLTAFFGVVMSLSYFPQAYKIYSRKSAADVSLSMYFLLLPGLVLWLIYGFSIGSVPLVLSNAASLAGCLLVVAFWFYYSR